MRKTVKRALMFAYLSSALVAGASLLTPARALASLPAECACCTGCTCSEGRCTCAECHTITCGSKCG